MALRPQPTLPLWLVRHARPKVAAGVCYGRLDVPACPEHTAQVAAQLAQRIPQGWTVVASTLQRCEHLAGDLRGLRPDLAYKTDVRLVELDFGAWEGQTWAQIGAAVLDAWVADFAHHAPGGGEPVSALLQRVADAWHEARPHTVWITHAGVMRALAVLQSGRWDAGTPLQAHEWPQAVVDFGAVWPCALPAAAPPRC